MCRRWNGGPALAAAIGSVEFEGAEHIRRYASSDWAERGFCGECGTNLLYFLKPARYIMWMGAFDDHPLPHRVRQVARIALFEGVRQTLGARCALGMVLLCG